MNAKEVLTCALPGKAKKLAAPARLEPSLAGELEWSSGECPPLSEQCEQYLQVSFNYLATLPPRIEGKLSCVSTTMVRDDTWVQHMTVPTKAKYNFLIPLAALPYF